LPVVFYWYWPLKLKEERRLTGFESRVTRQICEPKGDGVTGEWKVMYNYELYGLYYSPNIIKVIKSRIMIWVGHVARTGNRTGA
jgi:hypothetical protein